MQLEFTIENQRLSRTDKNFVVEKSQNYLYSHFDFTTNDWEVSTRYAIFTNEKYNQENALMVEIDLETNTCLVPYQILLDTCSFHVNVVGVNSDGEYIITTNESNVIVAKINTTNGIHPDEPQPSFLQQLFEKVSNSYNNFKFVYNETDGTLKLTMIDNDGKEFSKVVDLPMEQVVKNVSYNENTSTLTIEWINGQKTEINFEQFIKSYSADEITLTLSENNTFSIKQEWINEINQKIGKLEEHSISDLFYERITASDSTNSKYEIENGSIARPIKIGGITYKSENLLNLPDVAEKTINGVTYSIKNGVITFNGTATKDFNIYEIPLNLSGESFYVMPFGMVTTSNLFAMVIATSDWSKGRVFNYNNFVDGGVIDTWKPEIMQIQIVKGAVFNNVKFKPMLVSGSTAPTEFVPYFEGLRDTAVTGILSKGNNLLDINNVEIGSIGTDTGKLFDEETRLRNKDFINVIENNTYCFAMLDTIYTFKSILLYNNGNFIRADSTFANKTNVVYEIPSNINQIKLIIARKDNATITTFNDLQCMIVKDTTAPTEYEPYWEERFEISSAIQNLEGYGKGINETYNNYIDYDRKVFVQNVMEIDLGDYAWYTGGTNTTDIKRMYTNKLKDLILKWATLSTPAPILCKGYSTLSAYDTYQKKIGISVDDTGSILIYDENYNTSDNLASFNAHVKGIKAIIPLATPIETDISDLITEFQYKVDNIGTETLLNEYEQKAYAEIGYSVSLGKQIIENSNNIANKLDKVTSTGSNRVYVITSNGVQTTYRFSNKKGAYELIMRDANGEAEVNDISDNSSGYTIANKNYVDNTTVAKVTTVRRVYGTDENGNQTQIQYHQNANNYCLPLRDGNANFKVGNITESSDGNYVANKNYVDSLKKRIEQLEKASEGTILETLENDTQVSYVRQFEEGTLPYTLLEKVGGMTYKSENLLVIDDKETTTLNGVTYMIKNGVITLNGTATATTYITLIANCNLPLGTYSYNPKITTLPSGTFLNLSNVNGAYISNYAMTFENSVGRLQLQYNEGTVFSNIEIKPMLVSGSSIPSTFSQGFIGLRNTSVSEIISEGANLISLEDKEETTSYGITYTIKNGVITLNGTATKAFTLMWDIKIIKAGSCYFKWWYEGTTSATVFCYLYNVDHTAQLVSLNTNAILERTAELYENSDEYAIYIPSGAEINNLILKPMLVRGATAPTEYKPYKAPTIKEIPTAVQNLDGYGLGLPKVENCYNYVDFENNKFVKKLQKVVLDGSSDENIGLSMASNDNGIANFGFTFTNNGLSKHSKDGITDYFISNAPISHGLQTATTEEGVYINFTSLYIRVKSTTASTVEQLRAYLAQNPITVVYEMETPIETDISDLLAGFDNVEKVEPLGSLTFENEYGQAVPNALTYQRRL